MSHQKLFFFIAFFITAILNGSTSNKEREALFNKLGIISDNIDRKLSFNPNSTSTALLNRYARELMRISNQINKSDFDKLSKDKKEEIKDQIAQLSLKVINVSLR